MNPGYKTSEFWLSLAVIVAATVLFGLHRISAAEWTAATGGVGGFYTALRSWLKTFEHPQTLTTSLNTTGSSSVPDPESAVIPDAPPAS